MAHSMTNVLVVEGMRRPAGPANPITTSRKTMGNKTFAGLSPAGLQPARVGRAGAK